MAKHATTRIDRPPGRTVTCEADAGSLTFDGEPLHAWSSNPARLIAVRTARATVSVSARAPARVRTTGRWRSDARRR
jgi:hypothetical protein